MSNIYYEKDDNDYLMHHGKKGMKWGVRHDRQRLGSRHKSKSASVSNNKSAATKNLSKKPVGKKKKINWGAIMGTSMAVAVASASVAAPYIVLKTILKRRWLSHKPVGPYHP